MWKNYRHMFFWISHLFFLPLRLFYAWLRRDYAFHRGFVQALAVVSRQKI